MTDSTYQKIYSESEDIIKKLKAKDLDDAIRILENKEKEKGDKG